MQAAMIGLAGLMLAGGIGWVSWLRVAAPRNARRTSTRVEAELRALGLDGHPAGHAAGHAAVHAPVHPAPRKRGAAGGGRAAGSRLR